MSKFDSGTFRHVLGHYPTGVCIVTALTESGQAEGMAVGSFTSVSLDPPLVGFFPARTSSTWSRICNAKRFCVNVLAEDQEPLCSQFAMKNSEDKFAGVSHALSDSGLPVIDDVVAWIDCTRFAVHEAGDHMIVLGKVEALGLGSGTRPLLFCQGGYGQFAPMIA